MKRIALLGVLVLLSSGCGRGWLPTRGAACNAGCLTSAPAAHAQPTPGCSDCAAAGYGASYSGYDSGQILGDTGYYENTISNGFDRPIIGSGTAAPMIAPGT
jgi:hypothetical protein